MTGLRTVPGLTGARPTAPYPLCLCVRVRVCPCGCASGQLSSSGSITSATSYGNSGDDRVEGLAISSNSYVSVCGTYQYSMTMAGSTISNSYGTLTPFAATLQVRAKRFEVRSAGASKLMHGAPACAWTQVGSALSPTPAPTKAPSVSPSVSPTKAPTGTLWTSSLKSTEDASAYKIATHTSGASAVTGAYSGVIFAGSYTLTSEAYTTDGFVVGHYANGSVAWATTFGCSTGADIGNVSTRSLQR